ncbi:Ig-like domain-containing protein, partial [Acinetobacter lwoffii]|uniref:Ig-like domain-containing protein n=1 Tax=Acinetobacter lwoffii TaxID=28090 RepID=UPI003F8D3FF6
MNTTVKVISVDGDVWRFSNTNKKIILKKGAKLQTKDVLHLSEESNVVLQLSNGRVVEIQGKDLTNNDGNFSLSSLLGELNSDIDKIINFAKSFQQMNESQQQNDVVRLDDGRVFKKEGKDYVEIAGESFDEDPDVTQGGHRFVQLTRAGETSVADGIKPLMLNRVVDNIPPLGIQYPILSSVIKPFEHGLGGGSWTPLSPFAPTPNTPPVASDDTYNTAFNTPVTLNPLANDTDADGNPLTITAINGVTLTPGSAQQINTPNGVVNIDAQGNITFTPNAGFTGQESFSYSISDGQGGTSTATETINVAATIPPVASDDSYTTPYNTPVTLTPLANDSDADGGTLTITAINGVPLTPGTAQEINTPNGVVNIDAQGTITFTPNNGFTGQESFNYSISDGQGGSATATETINVSAAPTAAVNSVSQYEGSDLIHTVSLTGDSNSATTVTVTLSNGTATLGTDTTTVEYSLDGGVNWMTTTVSNAGSFNVSVPAHGTEFLVKVPSVQDGTLEGLESYTISVATPEQSTADTGTGTIVDDGSDPANPGQPGNPTTPGYDNDLRASVNDAAVYEGQNLTHDVTLNDSSSADTPVTVTLSNGSATLGTDTATVVTVEYADGSTASFTPDVNGQFTVTVPAGDTGFKVIVSSTDDTVFEGLESYTISVATPEQSTADTGTGTIVDDGSDPANPGQ